MYFSLVLFLEDIKLFWLKLSEENSAWGRHSMQHGKIWFEKLLWESYEELKIGLQGWKCLEALEIDAVTSPACSESQRATP